MVAAVSLLTTVFNASRLLTTTGGGSAAVPQTTETTVLGAASNAVSQNALDIAYIFSPPGNVGLLARPVTNVLLLEQAVDVSPPASSQSRNVSSSTSSTLGTFSLSSILPQESSSSINTLQPTKNNFKFAISAFLKTSNLSLNNSKHSFSKHI
jgi:hypothetical protein